MFFVFGKTKKISSRAQPPRRCTQSPWSAPTGSRAGHTQRYTPHFAREDLHHAPTTVFRACSPASTQAGGTGGPCEMTSSARSRRSLRERRAAPRAGYTQLGTRSAEPSCAAQRLVVQTFLGRWSSWTLLCSAAFLASPPSSRPCLGSTRATGTHLCVARCGAPVRGPREMPPGATSALAILLRKCTQTVSTRLLITPCALQAREGCSSYSVQRQRRRSL